jgi:repressor LexA
MESQTSRSLQLTSKAVELFEETIRSSRSKSGVEREPSRGLVVVGRIAAGVPIDAIEDHERFDLANAFDPDQHFLLRVKGDSMIDAHIADGDLVVIRKQETCENGEVVAAVIDGEATLKRFYRRKNHVELQPANQRLKSLRVKSVEIRGVVVGVIRQMG